MWGGVGWGGMLTYLYNARKFFQAFQSSNWHGTVVKSPFFKAMTLKKEKTRPKFFQDFQSSNWHGTVVKSPFFFKNVRFMGTVSGPAGCLCVWGGASMCYLCVCRHGGMSLL